VSEVAVPGRRRSDHACRVLGLIPARGGSKTVPRKNIRLLGGRPLLAYTADAALAAQRLARVIVSTDDQEVAEVARHSGVEVPFMRPAELATDAAPTLGVVQHALRWLQTHGEWYDAVCLLQPTSPFRQPGEIDGCIALLLETNVDAAMTVRQVPDEFNPHWTYERDDRGYLRLSTGEPTPISRRQDLPVAYHRDGSVLVTRREVVLQRDSLYGDRVVGYVMDVGPSVDLDSLADWARAESLLSAPPAEHIAHAADPQRGSVTW